MCTGCCSCVLYCTVYFPDVHFLDIIAKTAFFFVALISRSIYRQKTWTCEVKMILHCIVSCSETCKSAGNPTAKPSICRSCIQVFIKSFFPCVSYCFAQYQHIPGTNFPLLYTCGHLRCEQSSSTTCQMKPCGFFQQFWRFCSTCQYTFPPPSHLHRR